MSKDEVIQAIANIPGVTLVKQETQNSTSDDDDFNANETLKLILEIIVEVWLLFNHFIFF